MKSLPPAAKCRNTACTRKPGNGLRGLCKPCYLNPFIRVLYPSMRGQEEGTDDAPRAGRQPGDAPHRCFWCDRWRVNGPMQVCRECQVGYDERAATMPGQGTDNEEDE